MPRFTLLLALALAAEGCTPPAAEGPGPHRPQPPDSDAPSVDADGDGFAARDCDDTDPSIHPYAEELPDGLDQDCDGRIDEGTEANDDDRDGYTEQEGDCDDADRETHPNATDPYACDGIDRACTGREEPCESLEVAFFTVRGDRDRQIAGAVAGADLTGDGRPDLLTYHGSLWVWPVPDGGGSVDTSGASARVIADPDPEHADALAVLGDTDGDGFVEVVISGEGPAVSVISGPLAGAVMLADIALATYLGPEDSGFGWVIDAGQDANGDGVADLLVTDWTAGEGAGAVYLFSGDGRGTMDTASAFGRIQGDDGQDRIGFGARFSGDNDGDGLDDLLVTGEGSSTTRYRAGWFPGPLQGSVAFADADAFTEQPGAAYWYPLAQMGDVDGDGRDDLILWTVSAEETRLYLFTDGLRANPGEAAARIEADSYTQLAVSGAAAVVDVNGDGVGDLVLGHYGAVLGGYWLFGEHARPYSSGGAALFLSPLTGTHSVAEATRLWAGETPSASLGFDVAAVGDVDGDGFDDFALASPNFGDPEGADAFSGAAYLMRGSPDW